MSDYNSSLPIRTENNGDVVVRVSDATVTSQQLKVNTDGSIDANIIGGNITIGSEVEIKNDAGNPVPISAAALPLPTGAATLAEQQSQSSTLNSIDSKLTSPLSVSATNLDIRDLAFATDKVDTSGSVVALDSTTLAALENITVSASDLDIRDLSHVQDSIKIGDGTDFLSVNTDGSLNSREVMVAGIADYNTASAVAASGSSSHTYTAAANFYLTQVVAAGSGKMKIEVQVNGVSKFVQFSSTANTNMVIDLQSPLMITSGQTVVVIRTNRDNQSQDVYSSICGRLA